MDCTLTWPGVGPDSDVIQSLGDIAALGVTVVVATGRGTFTTAEIARELPAMAYAILNNGGIVRRVSDGHVLASQAYDSRRRGRGARGLSRLRHGRHLVESPFAAGRYLCDGAWWTHAPTRLYLSTKLPIIRPMPETAFAAPAVEVFAFGDREAVAGAERRINDKPGDSVSTVSWWSGRLGAGGLETLPAAGTKGGAVARQAGELCIDAAEVASVEGRQPCGS